MAKAEPAPELDLNKVRELAIRAFQKHRDAVQDLREMKADFIRRHPEANKFDRQFLFKDHPLVKDVIGDEQMYCRWALLYSNMVIMESLLMEQEYSP